MIKHISTQIMGLWGEERKGQKKYSKIFMAENVSNLKALNYTNKKFDEIQGG